MTASVGAPPTTEPAGAPTTSRARWLPEPALLAVFVGTAVLLVIHLLYWWTERRGFPLFVDESGYIGFAFDHTHALDRGGLSGLLDSFRDTPVYAQLVPLLTVPFHLVFGESVTASYLVVLAFYAVMIVATYGIARHMVPPWWAALAALVAALAPQIITFTRMYYFAVPVAAWLAVAVWCYLRSESCDRPGWAIAAGIALGLAPLSRTMALAFVPGPLVAAAVQVLAAPTRRVRRLAYLGTGALAGFALAWVWFGPNLSGARRQLEGRFQGEHGTGNPGLDRGAREIHQVVEVFQLPLVLVMAAAVGIALVFAYRRRASRPDDALAARVAEDRAAIDWRRMLQLAASPVAFVLIVLCEGAVALLAAREALAQWVPLVPFAAVLVVAALASLSAGGLRTALAAGLVVISLFNLVMLTDVWAPLGRHRVVDAGPLGNLTVTDGRHWIDTAYERRGYPTGRPGHIPEEYEEWPPLHAALTSFMVSYAADRDEAAVVLSQADALITPNDLILADRLLYEFPRIGVGPLRVGTDYREQLNSPEFGLPNFVLTIEPLATAPDVDRRERESPKVERALRAEDFEVVRVFELPDGRDAEVWWRPRSGAM